MAQIDFIQKIHKGTRRDYLERVVEHDKADSATIARQFGAEYWDGPRHIGYGGYRYDGRWRPIAEQIATHYGLKAGDRMLDLCCGKGYLLYEFTQAVPGIEVVGFDISTYAIEHSKPEIKPYILQGDATKPLPFEDGSFDFVISLSGLHNFEIDGVFAAFSEIARITRGTRGYIMNESFRNEREKANMLYWQLTCQSFHSPRAWEWIGEKAGYKGDHGFIYFE